MTTPTTDHATIPYLGVTEVAKLLRTALKNAFPAVKFAVRCARYSLGASIDVTWTDGPTEAQVDAITKPYSGRQLNALDDSSTYVLSIIPNPDGTEHRFQSGAHYVFTYRTLSETYLHTLESAATEMLGAPVERGRWYREGYTHRTLGVWPGNCTGHNLLLWLGARIPA